MSQNFTRHISLYNIEISFIQKKKLFANQKKNIEWNVNLIEFQVPWLKCWMMRKENEKIFGYDKIEKKICCTMYIVCLFVLSIIINFLWIINMIFKNIEWILMTEFAHVHWLFTFFFFQKNRNFFMYMYRFAIFALEVNCLLTIFIN